MGNYLISSPATPNSVKQSLANLPVYVLKEQILRSAEQLVKNQCDDINNNYGVTCFSEVNDNLLLWSHYGGQHRGFCLEFRADMPPLTKMRPVSYALDIPEVDIGRVMIADDFEIILNLFCTKSVDWAYEREWRVIHQQAGTVFTYAADALKAIYFGAKMSDQDIDLLCLILNGQNRGVELYRGHRSNEQFKIEFVQFNYTSLVDASSRTTC